MPPQLDFCMCCLQKGEVVGDYFRCTNTECPVYHLEVFVIELSDEKDGKRLNESD